MAVVYRECLTPEQTFLTLAVRDINGYATGERQRLVALYHQVGDESLWRAAAANKVTPYVAHALDLALGRSNIPPRWLEAHAWYEARNMRLLGELDRVARHIGEAGVCLVAVEAGSILCGVYPCVGCFSSDDIDLLVEPAHAAVVRRVMAAAGFEPDVQQWDVPSSRQGYCKRVAGDELWLVVMWEPFSRQWVAPIENLDSREILERSVPIQGRDTKVRLSSPEDHLLLCALHTSVHGYVRPPGLRLHLDVDRVIRYRALNWDVVIERARAWRVRRRVFVALAMAVGLLGTPVPEAVLDRLLPEEAQQARLLGLLAGKGVFEGSDKFDRLAFARLEASLDDRGWMRGLLRGIFPSPGWMVRRYDISNPWHLPLYYMRRFGAIAGAWHPSA